MKAGAQAMAAPPCPWAPGVADMEPALLGLPCLHESVTVLIACGSSPLESLLPYS